MANPERLVLDRPLEPVGVWSVIARTVLAMNEQGELIAPVALASAEDCGIRLGLTGGEREQFRKANAETFPKSANTFINRLINSGVLEHNWIAGPQVYQLNSEKASSLDALITLEGMETAEFVDTLDDIDHRIRCESVVMRAGQPDSLLRESMTVLEDRLRSLLPAGVRAQRRDLPAKILHPDSGVHKVFSETERQEDFFFLVRGLLGLYGTQVHHSLRNDLRIKTVRRVIATVDEVLALLAVSEEQQPA